MGNFNLVKNQEQFDSLVNLVSFENVLQHLREFDLESTYLLKYIDKIPNDYAHLLEIPNLKTLSDEIITMLINSELYINKSELLQSIIDCKRLEYFESDIVKQLENKNFNLIVSWGYTQNYQEIGKYCIFTQRYIAEKICKDADFSQEFKWQFENCIKQNCYQFEVENYNPGNVLYLCETSNFEKLVLNLDKHFEINKTIENLKNGVQHSKYSDIVIKFEKHEVLSNKRKISLKKCSIVYDENKYEVTKTGINSSLFFAYPYIENSFLKTMETIENFYTITLKN
jgi:hypothetical protein